MIYYTSGELMDFRKSLFFGLLIGCLLWLNAQFSPSQVVQSAFVATSEATPAAPLTVKFKGFDGITVSGLFYPTSQPSAPAVLLLNFKDSWRRWSPRWNALGFNVFAVDLRDFGSED